ncbi:MAG: Thioredoxin reductase, partial [uncultured Nocardioidaceae bacterium]
DAHGYRGGPAHRGRGTGGAVRRLLRRVPWALGGGGGLAAGAGRSDHGDVPREGHPRRGRLSGGQGQGPRRGARDASRHRAADVPAVAHRADAHFRGRGAPRRARRRHHGARQVRDHHRRDRQVHAPAAAGRAGLAGTRGGVLRAVVRRVRRQGRGHRGRWGQRVRLGARPRAGGRLGDAGPPQGRLPGPPGDRGQGAGRHRLGADELPRHAARRRQRPRVGGGRERQDARDHVGQGSGRRRGPRLRGGPRPDPAVGAGGRQAAHRRRLRHPHERAPRLRRRGHHRVPRQGAADRRGLRRGGDRGQQRGGGDQPRGAPVPRPLLRGL